jgi:hypothetical protein
MDNGAVVEHWEAAAARVAELRRDLARHAADVKKKAAAKRAPQSSAACAQASGKAAASARAAPTFTAGSVALEKASAKRRRAVPPGASARSVSGARVSAGM